MVATKNTREMTMKAKWIGLMAMAGLLIMGGGDTWAQNKSRGAGSASRSYFSSSTFYSQPATYSIGSTTYYTGQYYETGHPKVKRSGAVRREFLRQRGYSRAPEGYEVDHIVPLSHGGRDATYNMQLLPKAAHRAKTARERAR